MATSVTSYPKIGTTAWRALRARAVTAPSTKFNSANVATILSYDSVKSAADNVVYPMQKLGLIDESGTLTERGNKWRNDASYAEACQEILDAIYPSDLAGLTAADGSPDKAMVTRWFQYKNFGQANANKMAITYVMIAEKKLPEPPSDKESKPKAKKQAPGTAAKASNSASNPAANPAVNDAETTPVPPAQVAQSVARPDIHLDFQIHIAADARPDQIEAIFASMAKHLYSAA